MKKRKNIARIEKEKCGKMGNLIENVFRLKKYSEGWKWLWKIEYSEFLKSYDGKIRSIIRKELEKEIKRIDKMEYQK